MMYPVVSRYGGSHPLPTLYPFEDPAPSLLYRSLDEGDCRLEVDPIIRQAGVRRFFWMGNT